MVIISWMTRFTVLGVKLDQCGQCGQVCQHVVGRKTRWAGVFWLPLLFLGFQHGMACTTCRQWTALPWGQVRAATKTGYLPLPRARPDAQALLTAAAADDEPPLSPTLVFDRMSINPKRGPWDLYLKTWPVLVAAIIAVGALSPRSSSAASSTGGSNPAPAGTAHTCWLSTDGSISGCRLTNGTIQGYSTQTQTTCYFTEPLLDSKTTLSCKP